VARYSLFVLKVPLNPKQTNNQGLKQMSQDPRGKVKGKVDHASQENVGACYPPPLGLKPVGGEPLMSVTRVQCNARHLTFTLLYFYVTFPASMHHRSLAGTKLCCLVTGWKQMLHDSSGDVKGMQKGRCILL